MEVDAENLRHHKREQNALEKAALGKRWSEEKTNEDTMAGDDGGKQFTPAQ